MATTRSVPRGDACCIPWRVQPILGRHWCREIHNSAAEASVGRRPYQPPWPGLAGQPPDADWIGARSVRETIPRREMISSAAGGSDQSAGTKGWLVSAGGADLQGREAQDRPGPRLSLSVPGPRRLCSCGYRVATSGASFRKYLSKVCPMPKICVSCSSETDRNMAPSNIFRNCRLQLQR